MPKVLIAEERYQDTGTEVLYNLGDADYDSSTMVDYAEPDAEANAYPEAPPLPSRRISQGVDESAYHYEVPDANHVFEPDTRRETTKRAAVPYASMAEQEGNDTADLTWFKIAAAGLALLTISFLGGLLGGSVATLRPHGLCTCTPGTVVFATGDYVQDTCWAVADGTGETLDMMGLYPRPGRPENVGTMVEASIDVSSLSVTTSSVVDAESVAGVVGDHDTGVSLPVYYKLSTQAIAASHGSREGWLIEPTVTSVSAITSNGANETRPRSITLLPLVCL